MSKIEVNQISSQCGSTLTIGQSGDTIQLACGATQTGFGRTGTVDWDTTAKTASFTAVSGEGYFCNTSGGAFTVNLPAGSAGAIVSLADYAATWQTNNLTVSPNGTDKIGSINADVTLNVEGQSVTFVYVDGTQGWINTMDSTSNVRGTPPFVAATGGTITTVCTDYKVHTFTGPGTFTVTNAGTPAGSDTVDYLVVAGGGGAGGYTGGAGAGGFRESSGVASGCYSASPLGSGVSALPVSVQGYPITVGGGGAASASPGAKGTNGSNSVFSTITSTGGGASAGDTAPTRDGNPGGSGGSNSYVPSNPVLGNVGLGNTPPVSPPQGNDSGNTNSDQATYTTGGGGGGATAAGGNASAPTGAPGGAGATTSINATPTAFAGGGGGGSDAAKDVGCGGAGGGGKGVSPLIGTPAPERAGTANTGGGGGGGLGSPAPIRGGAGGSGIVIIRYKFQ
jgi:hypothetical protein